VVDLVGNWNGAIKTMTFTRRVDEHVTEQVKKVQTLDNNFEAQDKLLEELKMKIIHRDGEVWFDIYSCQKTIVVWRRTWRRG
jgi:hypothetical protein